MLVSQGFKKLYCTPAKPIIGLAVSCQRKVSYLPKAGPGGRSSFSGVVATVFGATGFLGRYVLNRLGRGGNQIIVPYRGDELDNRSLRLMGDLGQIMFFDYHLKDVESVAKVMKHSNCVINLIGREFETRNFSFDDAHCAGARVIAKAAREAGIKRLIHVSALNASEESPSKFLQSKARGEIAVREEFPEATILRPATLFGHEDHFLNYYAYLGRIPLGIPLIDGGMKTTKIPVFVADVAQAIVNAITEDESIGQTFELTGPEEYYLLDVLDYMYRVMRKELPYYTLPRRIYNIIAWGAEQSIFNPRLTRDMLLREFLSDQVTGLPGLVDLGVEASTLDTIAISVLRRHRDSFFFDDTIDSDSPCRPTSSYIAQ
ncbi:39kDa subunit of ndufa9, NADH:ubiquinone oxidoreductase [Desmophyllum pertusum]|uniref:NADH dehydrogenase [ubiquinone] 1 alpha subcomplex subunit 9, mitochondrial n=1 Tax=Desmophyllum pertusum TaxID=174260 RepID=A0A9W9ZVD3_9CNID|nr:39kDa subunit of ndufa9, NADH:ubiquinone oxidoreductase [Desmophyllum pertusum]